MVFYFLLISLVNKMQKNFYWKDLNIRNYLLHHRSIISSSLFLLLASWANKLSDLFVRKIKQLSFNFDEVKSCDSNYYYHYKGALLASATVPWHWLFYCPAPKFRAYFGCPVTKSIKTPKWHWMILAPMGALDYVILWLQPKSYRTKCKY